MMKYLFLALSLFLSTATLPAQNFAEIMSANAQDENVKHECAQFNEQLGAFAYTSTRQTSLESSIGDFSVSFWIIQSNSGLYVHRVVGVAENSTSNIQWMVQWNNPGGIISGASAHIRFILYTNSSNFMYIDSDAIGVRNRPTHIVCTRTGNSNTGLDMYINGVKQTGSRATTGSYTASYSNANLRFKLGREISDSFRGYLRDVAVWNKKLSDTEAAELYNNGRVRDVNLVSFYGSSIIGYYPLRTNTNCLNNSSLNLGTTSANLSWTKKAFNVRGKNISFKKVTVGNTQYVGFGSLVQTSSTAAAWYGRRGTTHLLGGKIVKIPIDLANRTTGTPIEVISDATYDIRGGSAAVINGSIYVFAARYNGGTDTFIDLNYWVSTDGLTGETFGARQTLPAGLLGFNAYGEVTAGFSAGEYFVPTNESNRVNQYRIVLYKTTNNGADGFANRIVVLDGVPAYTEPSLINLGNISGNNTMMILARLNGGSRGLWRIVSTDGGATWGTPVITNLANSIGESNAAMNLTEDGKVNVVWMDRSSDGLWASRQNSIASILALATAFNTAFRLANSYGADSLNILGYPNVLSLGNNQWLITYSAESASGVADLFIGFGELNE